MNDLEKVKHIREATMSPFNKINAALKTANGDVEAAIALLIKEKQADATDMANRIADTSIVHSYVHNNKVGAMIVLSCQTDFVAKNVLFLSLAKDICIHIASTPIEPKWIDESDVPVSEINAWKSDSANLIKNKPPQIAEKILDGKIKKNLQETCLLNQKFIKSEELTIRQLIQQISATVGEKIELKTFVKLNSNFGFSGSKNPCSCTH